MCNLLVHIHLSIYLAPAAPLRSCCSAFFTSCCCCSEGCDGEVCVQGCNRCRDCPPPLHLRLCQSRIAFWLLRRHWDVQALLHVSNLCGSVTRDCEGLSSSRREEGVESQVLGLRCDVNIDCGHLHVLRLQLSRREWGGGGFHHDESDFYESIHMGREWDGETSPYLSHTPQ